MIIVMLGWVVWFATLGRLRLRASCHPYYYPVYYLMGLLLIRPWALKPTALDSPISYAILLLWGF